MWLSHSGALEVLGIDRRTMDEVAALRQRGLRALVHGGDDLLVGRSRGVAGLPPTQMPTVGSKRCKQVATSRLASDLRQQGLILMSRAFPFQLKPSHALPGRWVSHFAMPARTSSSFS